MNTQTRSPRSHLTHGGMHRDHSGRRARNAVHREITDALSTRVTSTTTPNIEPKEATMNTTTTTSSAPATSTQVAPTLDTDTSAVLSEVLAEVKRLTAQATQEGAMSDAIKAGLSAAYRRLHTEPQATATVEVPAPSVEDQAPAVVTDQAAGHPDPTVVARAALGMINEARALIGVAPERIPPRRYGGRSAWDNTLTRLASKGAGPQTLVELTKEGLVVWTPSGEPHLFTADATAAHAIGEINAILADRAKRTGKGPVQIDVAPPESITSGQPQPQHAAVTATTRMTRTESILTTGIDMESVEDSGLEAMQAALELQDEYPCTVADVALEGPWAAGWEWMTQTRWMIADAAAAVSCPRDADLVRTALKAWYEPMGPQEWERLTAGLGWREFQGKVEAELTARRKAGYDTQVSA